MRKSIKLGLYTAVLAAVVGGTAAWTLTEKKVSVSIDGQARTVHTRAATVGGALKDAHIAVAEHDVVAPGKTASVHDGSKIVLRKGRLLRLNIDGQQRDVWTTATTVSEALAELGYGNGNGKTLSVSRSTRLPLSPTDLALRTLKHVTVKADGTSKPLYTGAATARDAITQAGVIVGPLDRVSVALTAKISEGQTIVVQRVRTASQSVSVSVPFETTSSNDANSYVGSTNVSVEGQNGVQSVTYALVYVDGKLTGRTQTSAVITQAPVTQVQTVGTKAVPAPTTTPATGTAPTSGSTGSSGSGSAATVPSGDAQAIAAKMVTAHGWGAEQFTCLVNLWNRESGWSTTAANPSGAYGIPQSLPGSKMASAGADWQTNPATQITWGLGYISDVYGTPCAAWAHSNATNWY